MNTTIVFQGLDVLMVGRNYEHLGHSEAMSLLQGALAFSAQSSAWNICLAGLCWSEPRVSYGFVATPI